MHLLATEPGMIADGSAAVDLGQTPGDIVVLANADTEIALLAAAQAGRRKADPLAPSLRLAPVMRLGHNVSVDVYMDNVARARLVVGRLLGGSAYWPYGVERLVETCRDNRIPLALLPGDDKPDPELARPPTVGRGARRLCPLPIFVQSLKDAEAASLLTSIFAAHPPAVILNATGFSVAASGGDDPLRADCPVLQIVFSGGDEEAWRTGTRGLGPRDLAMNVALPEIDGRILARAVSFKAPLGRDPETEVDLVGYRPVADRIAFVADLARNWPRLRE